jgi:hypothetical protein
VKHTRTGEGRSARSTAKKGGKAGLRKGAERDHSPSRPYDAQELANKRAAISRRHRIEETGRVVDHRHVKRIVVSRERCHRRHVDFHKHSRLGGALTRALGRRVVWRKRNGSTG